MEPAFKRRRIEVTTTDFLEEEMCCWEEAFYPGDFIDSGRYAIWEQELDPCNPEIEDFFRECEEAEKLNRARSMPSASSALTLRKPTLSSSSVPNNNGAAIPSHTSLPNTNNSIHSAFASSNNTNSNRQSQTSAIQRKLSTSKVIPPPTPISYVPTPISASNSHAAANVVTTRASPPSPPQIIQIPTSNSPPSPPMQTYGFDQNGAFYVQSQTPQGFFTQHVMLPTQMVMCYPNPVQANILPAQNPNSPPTITSSSTTTSNYITTSANLTQHHMIPQQPYIPTNKPGSPTRRGHVPASLNGISADGKPMMLEAEQQPKQQQQPKQPQPQQQKNCTDGKWEKTCNY